ncbi:MAG: hypothetical protein LVQ95_00760 [Candidatus Micrarchaeales archaeon]|nr:hypothetical protein [Candidatus Micrarchaeales archaeon]
MSFFKGHTPPAPPTSPATGNAPQGPNGPAGQFRRESGEESEKARKRRAEAEKGIKENVIGMQGWEGATLGELRKDVEKTFENRHSIGEDAALQLIRQKLSEVLGRLGEDMKERFSNPKAEREIEEAETGLPNTILLKPNPTPDEVRREADEMLADSLQQIGFVIGLIDSYFEAKRKSGSA